MPQLSQSTVSILPPTQQSGGSTKDAANAFRYASQKSDDAALWTKLADAISSLQSQIDTITQALRAAIPQPSLTLVTDSSGKVIAQIGNMTGSDNVAYAGIWTNILFAGGGAPNTAAVTVGPTGIHITDTANAKGTYIVNITEQTYIVNGATWNGTNWIATDVIATIFEVANGLVLFANVGLTIGSPFTPTQIAVIDGSGNLAVNGSIQGASFNVTGDTSFSGTLAAAVAGSKNVVSGLIQA